MPIKTYFEDVMYGRRRATFLEPVLTGLSFLYRAIIGMRSALYRFRIIRSMAVARPVISIGNVTLGGTGKTPMAIALAGFLAEKRKHPAVVSRGYGRSDESKIIVVSDGRTVLADARRGGDEPVLIGSSLSGVPVVVGSDRCLAAQYAINEFKAGVIVLDDGFQHLRLKRDLDIALVDGTDPFGNGRLFPSGILREPLTALRRAHAVVITKVDLTRDVAALKDRIGSLTDARIFTSELRPKDLVELASGNRQPLGSLSGTRVFAFSGIARPSSFLSLLRTLGADIRADRAYPDHYDYTRSDLSDLYRSAAEHRAEMIITTEKDAVRLKDLNTNGIWALSIELCILEREAWEAFIVSRV